MPNFYATFGGGSDNCRRYQIIKAPDRQAARALMFLHHGSAWAFLYDEMDKAKAIDAYDLTPLDNVLEKPE